MLAFTAWNLGTALVILWLTSVQRGLSVFQTSVFLLVSIVMLLGALVAILAFDQTGRRGAVLFEEISEELELHVRSRAQEAPARLSDPPGLTARIVLRDFARSTDLPMVPERSGSAIYAILNLTVTFGTAFFVSIQA